MHSHELSDRCLGGWLVPRNKTLYLLQGVCAVCHNVDLVDWRLDALHWMSWDMYTMKFAQSNDECRKSRKSRGTTGK